MGDWPAITPRQFGIVTALPASAVTGDLCTLTDSLTSPSYYWRLQYNGSDTSAYKWACVGGSPWHVAVETTVSTASVNTWVGSTPSVTVPVGGDFNCRWGADLSNSNTAAVNRVGLSVAGAAPAVWAEFMNGASFFTASVTREVLVTALAASSVLALEYLANAASLQYQWRWLTVLPRRVG